MKIQDIYIYPIKSLGGIRVEKAQVLTKGFRWDRRWMLVDESGKFLTQRTLHHMALLQVSLQEEGLMVQHKHRAELNLEIPFVPETDEFIPVNVWDDSLKGQIVSSRANQWFSKILKVNCKLVFMPESTVRNVEEKYSTNGETVSFADAMPYLLIGQSSLDDLNQKLDTPVPMERFRPNIVFSGGKAFEEDSWNEIIIGETRFKVTKPCARCVLTTVDQNTGTKGKEPLRTLATYRLKDKKVLFGQNLISLDHGVVKIGDKIIIK
ncbi:MOSC domain-containing protein [Echinicola sp. CAU 1574]|uniref:MOSC domain-containing protein n=1 Tax=Echinicola arenosa TaxID=2774144 RepID=A0ABR9AM36_9BACT|nr:MOSC N-terminal beta barrel domain-containing protein [Echinicola arenosa]MBD8489866.1 MOSC domain-containing protein [Echinicola arenosa]